ncbi:MAG: hypothetical protein GC206_05250 [Alphaproteobacteria bacterium]|nr:hypothetical protein [Alphaproteobacteria bacterium]
MKGTVLGYDPATMRGVISGEDGARYEFAVSEWKSGGAPAAGAKVDFEPSGGQAVGVYAAAGAAPGVSMDGAELMRLFMTRPPIAAAIAMIIGCLMPLYTVSVSFMGMGGPGGGGNLFDLSRGSGLLFWAVPIIAGVVLYFEFAKKDAGATPRNLVIAAGAVGVGMVLLFWFAGASMIAGQYGGMITLTPSLGAIVVAAGGALMLLHAFGVVRSFGAPPSA